MDGNPIVDSARFIFAALDRIIYWVAGLVYDIMKYMATISIFGNEQISQFATKIYGVMGLFMLFKVSFSLLTYIVDPDSFSDKSKGMGTIAKNIIIVLVLIILAPFAFDLLSDAQNIILNENILERFVFGTSTTDNHIMRSEVDDEIKDFKISEYCLDGTKVATDGDFVALSVFSTFYQPELDKVGTGKQYETKEDLMSFLNDAEDHDISYCTPTSGYATVGSYLDADLYNRENGTGSNDVYDVNYMFFWSTITGALLVLLFLNIAIEIAKRAAKLGFLELIAPIPIISYVDPKSGKDGMFKKWLKELGSTWASLFIRLGAVYFAVYVIGVVIETMQNQFVDNDQGFFLRIFTRLFFIFGCLLFAKELPKLIEKLVPGLNMSGSFNLNPMKNLRDNAVGGKAMFGLASAGLGYAGGLGANAWAAWNNNKKVAAEKGARTGFKERASDFFKNHDKWRDDREAWQEKGGTTWTQNIGSAIAGAHSAGFRSFWRTSKDGKIISGTSGGILRSSEIRNQRDNYNNEPGPFAYARGRVAARAHEVAGIKNTYGVFGQNDEQIKQLRNKEQEFSTYETRAREKQMDFAQKSGNDMRSFLEGFKRADNGLGDLNFNERDANGNYKYSGIYDYDRYVSMMSDINKGKTGSDVIKVLGALDFEEYLSLDNNTHYLNQQHEAVKKELTKQEKMFASNVKKSN